ncbi:Protein CBG02516 [Caenorhabditis briggsae]|uniref:Protein CBG02516 n=1 Tax=Caenorhabditis briggsae TaxID=6238 RepID=A8WU49_CAEBR|nr:Protein CBG02516 [Caenorhabditis briggsae]CAP24011.2 Protein CBG02516 [Caenorhabditis briggsae]
MSSTKKPKKYRVDDKTANVSPPWQAWYHPEKDKAFYRNTETNQSIWEHPSTLIGKKPSPQKPRKRQKVVSNVADDDRMVVTVIPKSKEDKLKIQEVDLPPPPKRKTTEDPEKEDIAPKRPKVSSASVEKLPRVYEASNSESKKITPTVPWSSKIRPLNLIPYRGCAIFDTCALLKDPNVLNASVENNILTVIPYIVLNELDGLKGSKNARLAASDVSRTLRILQEANNSYISVETSIEKQINIEEFLPDQMVNDDGILKCALRVKSEVLSIASSLKLNHPSVYLVTNDNVLSNKAMAHGLTVETIESFLDKIYRREKPEELPATKKKNGRKSSNHAARSYSDNKPQFTQHEVSIKKLEAIESVQKTRGVIGWIQKLARNVPERSGVERETVQKVIEKAEPRKSRPSIPLEDEIITSSVHSAKPMRIHNHSSSTYQSKKPVKSIETSRTRPAMPLSLSDDEDVLGDQMDCT